MSVSTEGRRTLLDRVRDTRVGQSMFRSPSRSTPRDRAAGHWSNFFLHVYPVKMKRKEIGFRFSYYLGVISTVLLGSLVASGIYLMFFYVPAPDSAYTDIQTIQTEITFGQYIRNVHRWSAHLMVLAVAAHMARVFYRGAYKKPRQFNWVIGVMLLVLTLLMSFTGYLLPWDQLAFWAVTVGTEMAAYVPLIGGDGPGDPAGRSGRGCSDAAPLLRPPRGCVADPHHHRVDGPPVALAQGLDARNRKE